MTMEGKKFTRRKLLIGGAVLGGAAALYLATKKGGIDTSLKGPEAQKNPLAFLNVPYQPRPYTLGRVAERTIRRKVGKEYQMRPIAFKGLLSDYTGIKGEVPKVASIDFRFQLARMWRNKLETMKKADGTYPQYALDAAGRLFEEFDGGKSSTTLENYRRSIDATIRGMRLAVDLKKITSLRAFQAFEPVQVELLQKLEKSIDKDSLLAYAVTELMPTKGKDAPIGLDIFDELLRNAGRNYIGLIPAQYDKLLSFGDYQFTEYALSERTITNEKGHKEERLGGASLINKIASSRQIPVSVVGLHGDVHHRAAYLFAIYNLAVLVRRLRENRSKQLLELLPSLPKSLITEYIATAHHKPADAMNAFETYLYECNGYAALKPETQRLRQKPEYEKHSRAQGVGHYTAKTKDNITAIRARFGARERSP